MLAVFLLVAIALLLCRRQPSRDCTLSAALLIAALTWLAIDVHLLHLLRDLFAVAVDHWFDTVVAFGAAVLLIVPATMLYVGIRDQMEERARRMERGERRGFGEAVPARAQHSVMDKFERRVATLMALGYSRTQAENTALHQMKRDMARPAGGQQSSSGR